MPAQRKYPEELRERAVKMVLEIREREGKSRGGIARVGRQLGIHPEALRTWIRQAEIDGRTRPDGHRGPPQKFYGARDILLQVRATRSQNDESTADAAFWQSSPHHPMQAHATARPG